MSIADVNFAIKAQRLLDLVGKHCALVACPDDKLGFEGIAEPSDILSVPGLASAYRRAWQAPMIWVRTEDYHRGQWVILEEDANDHSRRPATVPHTGTSG